MFTKYVVYEDWLDQDILDLTKVGFTTNVWRLMSTEQTMHKDWCEKNKMFWFKYAYRYYMLLFKNVWLHN